MEDNTQYEQEIQDEYGAEEGGGGTVTVEPDIPDNDTVDDNDAEAVGDAADESAEDMPEESDEESPDRITEEEFNDGGMGAQQDGEQFSGPGIAPLAPSAMELMNDPIIKRAGDNLNDRDIMEPPFDQAMSKLFITSGPLLQMTTRMNPRIAVALDSIYNLDSNYHCPYLSGRGDLLMRLAVSMGGLGRDEVVRALSAGGSISSGFYEAELGLDQKKNVNQSFREVEEI